MALIPRLLIRGDLPGLEAAQVEVRHREEQWTVLLNGVADMRTKLLNSYFFLVYITLHDWLCVMDWYDKIQPISQEETVKHFKTLNDDALLFNQASLSCHLTQKGHKQDLAKLAATPTALSSKHACIVTRPDVKEALKLWVEHMESKQEHVTQVMLIKKQGQFEDMLEVPEFQRLQSGG